MSPPKPQHHAPAEGQPEAGAVVLAGGLELMEQARHQLGRDAGAGVVDHDAPCRIASHGERDLHVGTDRHVVERVLQQVEQHQLHGGRVGAELEVLGDVDVHAGPLAFVVVGIGLRPPAGCSAAPTVSASATASCSDVRNCCRVRSIDCRPCITACCPCCTVASSAARSVADSCAPCATIGRRQCRRDAVERMPHLGQRVAHLVRDGAGQSRIQLAHALDLGPLLSLVREGAADDDQERARARQTRTRAGRSSAGSVSQLGGQREQRSRRPAWRWCCASRPAG